MLKRVVNTTYAVLRSTITPTHLAPVCRPRLPPASATIARHFAYNHTLRSFQSKLSTSVLRQQTRQYQRGFNYQRFQRNQAYFRRWAQHPYFYYHVAAMGGTVALIYVVNLEQVPVSHRRRFRIVPYDIEAQLGAQLYQQLMQEYKSSLLPHSHPYYKQVERVAKRLIPHSGLPDEKWEVHVIQDDQKNAFVVPGGKIFVFSGMFDICKSDDSLAAVIGHEIGHNVAHHSAERASAGVFVMAASLALAIVIGSDFGQSMLLDLIFTRPGSRTQETEADYIGLLMMAEACYNPEAAMDMWATMERIDKNSPPQWISTHPSNHNRLEKIRQWLPEAQRKLEESGCSMSMTNFQPFWDSSARYK